MLHCGCSFVLFSSKLLYSPDDKEDSNAAVDEDEVSGEMSRVDEREDHASSRKSHIRAYPSQLQLINVWVSASYASS